VLVQDRLIAVQMFDLLIFLSQEDVKTTDLQGKEFRGKERAIA
jgi:hypothetical protein